MIGVEEYRLDGFLFFFFIGVQPTVITYTISHFFFFLSDTLYIIINYIIIYSDTNLLDHVLN